MNIKKHLLHVAILTLISVGLVYATAPEFIIKTITLDDGSNTVCLALDGDAIYHDTDADGTKDAGEEYLNISTLPITRGGTGATSLSANAVPRSTGSALAAGLISDDGTRTSFSGGGILLDGTGSYVADKTQIYNTTSGGTVFTCTSGSGTDFDFYNSAGSRVFTVPPDSTNFVLAGKYTDADGDTAIDLEEAADDDTIRFDAGGTEVAAVNTTGIGVGTATPDTKLHTVVDVASVSLGTTAQGGLSLTNTNQTDNNWSAIWFNDAVAGAASVALGVQYTDHANNYGGMEVKTRGTDGLASRWRIDEPAAGETSLWLYDDDNNTLERVTVGAADSGGAGYKVLRIPN